METIKDNLRARKPFDASKASIETLQYAAGLSDTDGSFQISLNAPRFYIGQSEKGIGCLHFMYDAFGGEIILHKKGNEKHQTCYQWILYSKDSFDYCCKIKEYLILKKREAAAIVEFPIDNRLGMPVKYEAINETGQILTFKKMSDISKHLDKKINLTSYKTIVDSWEITKIYKNSDETRIAIKKYEIDKLLRKYHHEPHDDIPNDLVPSKAWIAGVMDGEAHFAVNGKSGQHHSITQKWPQLLQLMHRLYGGSIWYRKGSDTWAWSVHTEAKRLVKDIAPFIHGKKKQVELLLNMKPGEAPQVHVKLRELKGNCTAPTPRIDALNEGAPGIRATVEKEHTAPRKLPTGVFQSGTSKTRVKAQIQYDKKIYVLGMFDVDKADEAHELYLKYKDAISAMKRGGPKVDFSGLEFLERK